MSRRPSIAEATTDRFRSHFNAAGSKQQGRYSQREFKRGSWSALVFILFNTGTSQQSPNQLPALPAAQSVTVPGVMARRLPLVAATILHSVTKGVCIVA